MLYLIQLSFTVVVLDMIHPIALYMGRIFQYPHNNNQTYNTGGPGYVLNGAALKVRLFLVSRLL